MASSRYITRPEAVTSGRTQAISTCASNVVESLRGGIYDGAVNTQMNGSCYTFTDEGKFVEIKDSEIIAKLDIVAERYLMICTLIETATRENVSLQKWVSSNVGSKGVKDMQMLARAIKKKELYVADYGIGEIVSYARTKEDGCITSGVDKSVEEKVELVADQQDVPVVTETVSLDDYMTRLGDSSVPEEVVEDVELVPYLKKSAALIEEFSKSKLVSECQVAVSGSTAVEPVDAKKIDKKADRQKSKDQSVIEKILSANGGDKGVVGVIGGCASSDDALSKLASVPRQIRSSTRYVDYDYVTDTVNYSWKSIQIEVAVSFLGRTLTLSLPQIVLMEELKWAVCGSLTSGKKKNNEWFDQFTVSVECGTFKDKMVYLDGMSKVVIGGGIKGGMQTVARTLGIATQVGRLPETLTALGELTTGVLSAVGEITGVSQLIESTLESRARQVAQESKEQSVVLGSSQEKELTSLGTVDARVPGESRSTMMLDEDRYARWVDLPKGSDKGMYPYKDALLYIAEKSANLAVTNEVKTTNVIEAIMSTMNGNAMSCVDSVCMTSATGLNVTRGTIAQLYPTGVGAAGRTEMAVNMAGEVTISREGKGPRRLLGTLAAGVWDKTSPGNDFVTTGSIARIVKDGMMNGLNTTYAVAEFMRSTEVSGYHSCSGFVANVVRNLLLGVPQIGDVGLTGGINLGTRNEFSVSYCGGAIPCYAVTLNTFMSMRYPTNAVTVFDAGWRATLLGRLDDDSVTGVAVVPVTGRLTPRELSLMVCSQLRGPKFIQTQTHTVRNRGGGPFLCDTGTGAEVSVEVLSPVVEGPGVVLFVVNDTAATGDVVRIELPGGNTYNVPVVNGTAAPIATMIDGAAAAMTSTGYTPILWDYTEADNVITSIGPLTDNEAYVLPFIAETCCLTRPAQLAVTMQGYNGVSSGTVGMTGDYWAGDGTSPYGGTNYDVMANTSGTHVIWNQTPGASVNTYTLTTNPISFNRCNCSPSGVYCRNVRATSLHFGDLYDWNHSGVRIPYGYQVWSQPGLSYVQWLFQIFGYSTLRTTTLGFVRCGDDITQRVLAAGINIAICFDSAMMSRGISAAWLGTTDNISGTDLPESIVVDHPGAKLENFTHAYRNWVVLRSMLRRTAFNPFGGVGYLGNFGISWDLPCMDKTMYAVGSWSKRMRALYVPSAYRFSISQALHFLNAMYGDSIGEVEEATEKIITYDKSVVLPRVLIGEASVFTPTNTSSDGLLVDFDASVVKGCDVRAVVDVEYGGKSKIPSSVVSVRIARLYHIITGQSYGPMYNVASNPLVSPFMGILSLALRDGTTVGSGFVPIPYVFVGRGMLEYKDIKDLMPGLYDRLPWGASTFVAVQQCVAALDCGIHRLWHRPINTLPMRLTFWVVRMSNPFETPAQQGGQMALLINPSKGFGNPNSYLGDDTIDKAYDEGSRTVLSRFLKTAAGVSGATAPKDDKADVSGDVATSIKQ